MKELNNKITHLHWDVYSFAVNKIPSADLDSVNLIQVSSNRYILSGPRPIPVVDLILERLYES